MTIRDVYDELFVPTGSLSAKAKTIQSSNRDAYFTQRQDTVDTQDNLRSTAGSVNPFTLQSAVKRSKIFADDPTPWTLPPTSASSNLFQPSVGTGLFYPVQGGEIFQPQESRSIFWSFSQDGCLPPFGWSLSLAGGDSIVRFDVEDSLNCGGTNNNVQSGKATGTVFTTSRTRISIDLFGIGERQDLGYEIMSISINGIEVIRGESLGDGSGCEMGPCTIDFLKSSPYTLEPGEHKLILQFTTADNQFHVGAFYECTISFV